jgi:hypothetical protein
MGKEAGIQKPSHKCFLGGRSGACPDPVGSSDIKLPDRTGFSS